LRISKLYESGGVANGEDAYVVGLGPSMTVFPMALLEGKFCVLLNDAQKFFPTLGPVALANHKGFLSPLSDRIAYPIVKGRLKSDPNPYRHDNHVSWDHPSRYVFSYRTKPPDLIDTMDEASIWREPDFYWRGPVAVYAVQFLLLAGARSITLVGCDCGPLAGMDYCNPQAEEFRRQLAKTPERKNGLIGLRHNYRDYAYGLVRLRVEAKKRGVPLVSLSPFFGLDQAESQFRAMREQDGNPVSGPVPDRSLLSQRRAAVRASRMLKNMKNKKTQQRLREGKQIR
jgi:hypothetical protein